MKLYSLYYLYIAQIKVIVLPLQNFLLGIIEDHNPPKACKLIIQFLTLKYISSQKESNQVDYVPYVKF